MLWQGVVTNTLESYLEGTVGLIVWLDVRVINTHRASRRMQQSPLLSYAG